MLYIIRHGQTQLNRAQVLQGRSNHPMNEEGCRQAAEVGEWLRGQGIHFDRVYASPLIRAIQTAQLVCDKDMEITLDDRLIEMDYGPYEGMDLTSPTPEILEFFRDFQNNPAPEGMEQLPDVVKRLGEFLEEILPQAEKENILVSTHAIAMKGALEYLTPDSNGSYWNKNITNCAIYYSDIENGYYTVPADLKDER